jgi:hypothetical protein|tara:strand:- start:209 stop:841 length:633 start_codon:yes stop_codon:yes gene_type:complete
MKSNLFLLTLGAALSLATNCNAASFTIGGGSVVSWKDSGGGTIATSSIVQVGYFNLPDSATDPSTYSPADWDSFVAISGIDSLNASKDTNVNDAGGAGTFDISLGLNSATDTLPPSYNKRLGIRVYESTTATTGVNYNTVSASVAGWVLQDPDVEPAPTAPNLIILATDEPGIAWQDGGANAFQTTIVPEPSSFALLGLGALALTFRRKK